MRSNLALEPTVSMGGRTARRGSVRTLVAISAVQLTASNGRVFT
jgi:hypothetical protein